MTDAPRVPDVRRLEELMRELRAGCPWTRAQTLDSLEPYLIEEAWELLDAMRQRDPALHREELADLLLQIVFQTRIRGEEGHFELADVVDELCDKLVRRHPHVFAEEDAPDAEAVARQWEAVKRAEGKERLEGIPRSLPALTRAFKVGKRASGLGFDWPEVSGALDKLEEEVAELRRAVAEEPDAGAAAGTERGASAAAREIGDVLFAVANVARHLDVDPELALGDTTERFLERFRWMADRLTERGLQAHEVDLETLDALWEQAKEALAGGR